MCEGGTSSLSRRKETPCFCFLLVSALFLFQFLHYITIFELCCVVLCVMRPCGSLKRAKSDVLLLCITESSFTLWPFQRSVSMGSKRIPTGYLPRTQEGRRSNAAKGGNSVHERTIEDALQRRTSQFQKLDVPPRIPPRGGRAPSEASRWKDSMMPKRPSSSTSLCSVPKAPRPMCSWRSRTRRQLQQLEC
jgi:hypothetical protein